MSIPERQGRVLDLRLRVRTRRELIRCLDGREMDERTAA